MLRRLISAVFVLSLVLALNGTAVSDVVEGELTPDINPVIKIDPTNPKYVSIRDARPQQPTFKKPEDALKVLPPGMSAPTPPYFNDVQDYTNGVPFYYWPIPDAYGDDLFNMRFTSDKGYDCEVIQAHYLMYGTAMVGTPDMRCYIWDDDGFGFPLAKMDSVDISYATLAANTVPMGYVTAVFPGSHVFSDGEEHHLGWTMIGGIGDTLAIISDDATGSSSLEERASEFFSSTWGTMLNDWGLDVSFFILNERECIERPYTDCYWQYYYTNIAYLWPAPDPTWGNIEYAMRYSVGGPETLQFVDFAVYDWDNGSFGTDDIYMTVYTDTNGFPDAQIAQVTVPVGSYVAFPGWSTADFSSLHLVMADDFHVSFSSSGAVDYECCLSSDGSDGVGRSSTRYAPGGSWASMMDDCGADVNFLFDAYMCKDPFKFCAWQSHNNGLAYYYPVPDNNPLTAWAQKMRSNGPACRVYDVCWYLYATDATYADSSKVSVYTDVGGLPGAEVASIIWQPADYLMYPAATCADFYPDEVYVSSDHWIAIESYSPTFRDLNILLDDKDVGGGGMNDGVAFLYGTSWLMSWSTFGWAQDFATVSEVYECCEEWPELVCYPSEDWPTYQRDYARTGHSMNAVDDAWCDLTLNWNYTHPTLGNTYPSCGPIIAYDKVVQAFSSSSVSEYKVFNLYSGVLLYTLTGSPEIGSNVQTTPTVAMIAGYPDPILFTAGGLFGTVSAWDFNTGAPLWNRSDYSACGMNRWGRFMVVNVGGIDVLVWGTDNGCVVAADALTGALFDNVNFPGVGWMTNPITLPLPNYISGATDGYHLYYNTYGGSGPGATPGDVYSIDASTGLIIWQLSGTSGLQGPVVWTHANGYVGDEGFTSGIMYDNGDIYTNSRAEADHPTDGLFYSINAASGFVNYAALSNRVFYSTPIMDANHCYMPTLTRWMSPPGGGNLLGINRNSGVIEKSFTNANADRYYVDAVASCEPGDGDYPEDLIYAFSEEGFLSCINSVTFEEVYRRRVNHGNVSFINIGMSGAIAHDAEGQVHVAFADFYGCLFDMTKQDDRPRLQIETYNPTTAVEFGVDPMWPVSWDDVFYNSGCAELLFDYVNADEDVCPGMYIPDFASAVDPNFMDRAEKIANDLTRDAFLSKYLRPNSNILDESGMQSVREMDFEKETINRAAAGWPPFLVSVDWPQVGSAISAGAYHSLDLTVNQALISRGPQCFYLVVGTNDPDFFLCNPDQDPCMHVCLVGGCLIDTTTLHFGMGCPDANEQLVTNTGRLGNGDWGDGAAGHNGFLIDADGASYYQGAYVYAISTQQIAVHTQDWTSGGGEADAFVSMQPDPNWCDVDECKPYLKTDEPCGEITRDGGDNYETILVDKVCKSFLDSVQDFGYLGAWDWEAFGAPFSNALTMGLYCNGAVYAACEVPELTNVTVEVLQFYERNGNAVEGWYLGEMYDCDNGGDEIGIDRSISTAWTYNTPAADQAIGHVKIPFGCVCVCNSHADREPLINIWGTCGISASQGFWNWIQFWDACYGYMTSGPGLFYEGDMHAGDEEAFLTFAGHDFVPYDTYEVAIAHFILHEMADASSSAEMAPLAVLVNKWAGWGRGDVNNDGAINLCDIVYLAATVNGGPGAVPFKHLSDVNADGNIDILDVDYLIDFYFNCGTCPIGAWICDP